MIRASMKKRKTRMLREKDFWRIIKKSRTLLSRTPDAQQQRLIRLLTKRSLPEIITFDRMYQYFMGLANTWDLRAAAQIVCGDAHDQAFVDFRGWLVSRGKKHYYRVLEDPEHLEDLIPVGDPCDWHGFDFCAVEAYEQITGIPLADASATVGQKWEEADLPALYPALWKKYVVVE